MTPQLAERPTAAPLALTLFTRRAVLVAPVKAVRFDERRQVGVLSDGTPAANMYRDRTMSSFGGPSTPEEHESNDHYVPTGAINF